MIFKLQFVIRATSARFRYNCLVLLETSECRITTNPLVWRYINGKGRIEMNVFCL